MIDRILVSLRQSELKIPFDILDAQLSLNLSDVTFLTIIEHLICECWKTQIMMSKLVTCLR